MSRSNSRPSGKPGTASSEALFPAIGCPWLVSMAAVPAKTRSAMRTVDPEPRVGAARAEETDSRFLLARAGEVVEKLECAAKEKPDDETTVTRLLFSETRNETTGEWGIVVRELLSPGRFSRPLAELLPTDGELTDAVKDQGNRLGWNAANRTLEIVVFKEHAEKDPRPAAFAAVRIAGRPKTVTFHILARLLVTPFEVNQWTDPFLEMKVGSVS